MLWTSVCGASQPDAAFSVDRLIRAVENSEQKGSGPFQTGSFLKAAAAVVTNDSVWMVSCSLVCHLNTIHAENQRWLLLPDAPTLENDFSNVAVLLINAVLAVRMEAQKVQTSPLRRRWVIKIKCLNESPVITNLDHVQNWFPVSRYIMSPVWIPAVSLFWPTVALTGGAQSDSESLGTVIQLCLSDLLPRSSDVFLWANTRELGVKLSNCLAPSPTSPPLSQRGENDSQLGGLRHKHNGSDCAERGRPARLSQPSPSKKAPITEAITPSRDGERQHKQCAGTLRSSPPIQLQSRWSHIVSRCGCSSQSAVTRESLHAALWSTASRHQHAGGDAYVMKYAAKKRPPLQTNKIFFNVEVMCRYQAEISAAEVNKTSGIKIQFHSCCCLVTSFMWWPSINILPRQINRVKVNGYSQENTYFLCCLSSDYSK